MLHYRAWQRRNYKDLTLRCNTDGFTLVELVITVAILGLLTGIIMSTFSDYAARQQATSEINDVTRSVIEQRSRALAALDDSEHGVHVASSSITFFEGTTYSAGANGNRIISLLATDATSSFSNGLTYISFSRMTGEPSATGTIELFSSRLQSTTTITIHDSGLIE